jgi:hypothetical protein
MPKCIEESITYGNKATVHNGPVGSYDTVSPMITITKKFNGQLSAKKRETEYEKIKLDVDSRLSKKVKKIEIIRKRKYFKQDN